MKKACMSFVLLMLCIALPRPSTDIPRFKVGLNYAWNHYGFDYGGFPGLNRTRKNLGLETDAQKIFSDFEYLKCYLVDLVRIFVHCDLRAGITWSEQGYFQEFDEQVGKDLLIPLEAAKANRLQVILSLLDFMVADGLEGWCGLGEHPSIITNAGERQRFMNAIKKELIALRPYISQLYAVETMNEPENVTAVTPEQLELFLSELAETIHQALPGVPVTTGSATRLGADLFQRGTNIVSFHHYDKFDWVLHLPYNFPARNVHPSQPVIISETEASLVQRKLETAYKNGYAGVCFWSFRDHNGHLPKLTRIELNEIRLWKEKHGLR